MKKECSNSNKNVDVKNAESNKKKNKNKDETKMEDRYLTAVENAQEIEVINYVMIQTVTMQMTFSSIMSGLERGDYIIPDFQRMYRWTEKQVEELAISLLRGMPIPPIYCYRNQENQIIILDGQQRMLSLYLYYIGKYLKRKKNAFMDLRKILKQEEGFRERLENYGLIDKNYFMKYQQSDGTQKEENITYEHLSERVKRKIDYSTIMLIEINVDSEEHKAQILHKIFANLNTGGTPLSSQELRNGIYGCRFYDMLYDINDYSQEWRQIYSGSPHAEVNKESKDVELLLKMCAFKYFVKGNGEALSLTGYRGKITLLLEDFSEIAGKFHDQEIAVYQKALLSFFNSIEVSRTQNKELALISIFVVWERMEHKPFITKQKYEEIIADKKYSSTIKSGTFRKGVIENRLRSVYEQLSKYDS